MSSRTINVVFVWAVIVLCQGLAGSEPVIVGLYDNPPKLSQAPSGVAVGFFPDLLDGIADAKGWEIEYRHGSWEVLLNWLESGEIDLLPDIAFSEERAARFAFSQEPVLSSWSTLYVPRGKAGMIVSELDLEGMRIAILPGSIQFIDLDRDLTALEVAVDYVEFGDFTSALEAVAAGEVDAALTNRLVGDLFVKERGQLEATSLIICPVQVYFAALSGPNEAILGAIDEQLLALKAEPDSLYHRAFNEWIRPVIAEQPRFFTLAMSAIGIALLAVVAFLFVRQRLNSRSTDLKRALKHVEKLNTALQVSEERQELAMANSRVALWDWDIEKHEVIFNEHWAKMLGMQLSDIPQPAKAEFWNEYTHPEDLEKVDLQLAEHFAGKRDSIECELRMRHLDGHYLWTLNRGAVIEWNEKGEAKRMVGTQAEITALVEAREEAERANRAKSDFLAVMNHELRTPLNAIIGPAEILSTEIEDPGHREMLELIQTSSNHLLSLIREILDLSQIESGRYKLHKDWFKLSEFFDTSLGPIREVIERKGLLYSQKLSDSLPREVRGDRTALQQVLMNLMGNAEKFTFEGVIAVSADWTEGDEPGEGILRVKVSDTGCGIPEDSKERIFSAFEQVDMSVNRQHGGVGLGLAISAQLMNLMGGRLWLEDSDGSGSCFALEIPLSSRSGPSATQLAEMPVAANEGKQVFHPKVLVVEDHLLNRKVMRQMLSSLGVQPVLAAGGKEAIGLCREQLFDIVFMDMRMPGMDGIEVTRQLRSLEGGDHLWIIAQTAYALSQQRETCLEAGLNDFISKPLTMDNLRKVMKRARQEFARRDAQSESN